MGHGKKKGLVDGRFQARIDDLEKKARKMADHFRNHGDFREWHVPPTFNDPLDVPSLHNPAWDRNNLNETYSEKVLARAADEAGTDGDKIALKWQIDFMACEERAFRTRHASLIRCASLAHGRIDGHGKIKKGVFTFLKEGVETALKLGAKSK